MTAAGAVPRATARHQHRHGAVRVPDATGHAKHLTNTIDSAASVSVRITPPTT
jgi:hypothetical protein